MTAEGGVFLADAWVSLCGACGALIVLGRLSELTPSPALARRFKACLWVIIVLMVMRVGHWAEWGWLFTTTTHTAAALLPLVALLIGEGMMRLHAPKWLKRFCGWGAVVFVALAILPTGWMEFTHILGLLLFQLGGLTGVAWFVLRRDSSLLSGPENQSLNRMVLSFGLILPLLATDFFGPELDFVPVRLGGVAVLGLCLLTISINRTSLSRRRIISSMLGLIAGVILLTYVVAVLGDVTAGTGVRIGAVLLAGIMLLGTWQAARALEVEDRYALMLHEIARTKGSGLQAAVATIQRGAGVPDALVLQGNDLADFDAVTLAALFAERPVRAQIGAQDNEQLAWLFSRFEASHAIAISDDPLILVVFNHPALTTSRSDTDGLTALQRIAAQTAKKTAP